MTATEQKYVRTICVDFDGVVHSYTSGWQGIDVIPDPPVDEALAWLMALAMDERFKPVIYSSRSKDPKGVEAMRAWFHEHAPALDGELEFPTQKPAAYLTVDDRCWNFRGHFPTMRELMEFRPWNKGGHSDIDNGSGIMTHAMREMELAGLFGDDEDGDGLRQSAINDQVLAMLRIFCAEGHSGSSAEYTIDLLTNLLRRRPLTPITNDPREWIDRSEESGKPLWQNERDSEAFSEDGGKTYYLLRDGGEKIHTAKEHV